MKRAIIMMVVVVLCAVMVLPVCAAEPGFVPSITYKDGPEMESAVTDNTDRSSCLEITSIKEAKEKSTDITQDARDLLLDVYTQLRKEKVKLPLEHEYVVLELVDISFKQTACIEKEHGHKEALDKDGTTITVTFKLDVKKDVQLDVLAYVDGKWQKVESVVNNGDGTATCVFERFCPVAFCVPAAQYEGPTQTGDDTPITLWVFLMVAGLLGIALVSMHYLRGGKENK